MKLEFRATIHDTPAALRFGGDEAYITLMVPASDAENAVGLIALKKTPLKITVEVDEQTQAVNEFKDYVGEIGKSTKAIDLRASARRK